MLGSDHDDERSSDASPHSADAAHDNTPAAVPRLLHQINNLLAVIHTQVALARHAKDPTQWRRALELIEDSALRTDCVVREVRAELGGVPRPDA